MYYESRLLYYTPSASWRKGYYEALVFWGETDDSGISDDPIDTRDYYGIYIQLKKNSVAATNLRLQTLKELVPRFYLVEVLADHDSYYIFEPIRKHSKILMRAADSFWTGWEEEPISSITFLARLRNLLCVHEE